VSSRLPRAVAGSAKWSAVDLHGFRTQVGVTVEESEEHGAIFLRAEAIQRVGWGPACGRDAGLGVAC